MASTTNFAFPANAGAAPQGYRQGTLIWLARALIAGGLGAGSACFAQYPPNYYSAPYSPAYSSPYAPASPYASAYPSAYTQQAPSQGEQTDEQLLTIGRLLEQQGRYAQAQRIYTELERRRMAGLQQPANMAANVPYQGQGAFASQGAVPPAAWQSGSPSVAGGIAAPMMQSVPQNSPPLYEQRNQTVNAIAPPSVSSPPPAPPSQEYVVDTEYTPPPKTTSPAGIEGWRNSFAPLPAALRSWSQDYPTPYGQQVTAGTAQSGQPRGGAPTTGASTTEPNALPDLPIAPVAPLGSVGSPFPPAVQPARSEPPRFVPPTVWSGERPLPAAPDREVTAPPTMRLRPMPEKNAETLDSEREAYQQSDAIRIIPGQRVPVPLQSEKDSSSDDPLDRPVNVAAPDKPRAAWTAKPPISNVPAEQVPLAKTESNSCENSLRFDLAAWLATPEFREIHTAAVLEGLDLLARPEPRHRAAGAMRIAAAGPDARTALPVLRKMLVTEAEKAVRLRIAECVLKVQPNDRTATEILSDFLSERSDGQLRQCAASALGGAAAGFGSGGTGRRNSIAIARLTDALDDSNPGVRAAAAASLALFGPAAVNSISRLEGAASNDVPAVQRAALRALASIRGSQVESATERPDAAVRENPFEFKPVASGLANPVPAATSTGRVRLGDSSTMAQSGASEAPASGANEAAALPPKLFPEDRMGNARSLMPAPEFSDDDAVTANAIDADAPPKPLTAAPAAATQPMQLQSSPTQAPPLPQALVLSPQALPLPPAPPLPFVQPAADVLAAQPAPRGPSVESPPGVPSVQPTPSFLLQSEAGASKASSHP